MNEEQREYYLDDKEYYDECIEKLYSDKTESELRSSMNAYWQLAGCANRKEMNHHCMVMGHLIGEKL